MEKNIYNCYNLLRERYIYIISIQSYKGIIGNESNLFVIKKLSSEKNNWSYMYND